MVDPVTNISNTVACLSEDVTCNEGLSRRFFMFCVVEFYILSTRNVFIFNGQTDVNDNIYVTEVYADLQYFVYFLFAFLMFKRKQIYVGKITFGPMFCIQTVNRLRDMKQRYEVTFNCNRPVVLPVEEYGRR